MNTNNHTKNTDNFSNNIFQPVNEVSELEYNEFEHGLIMDFGPSPKDYYSNYKLVIPRLSQSSNNIQVLNTTLSDNKSNLTDIRNWLKKYILMSKKIGLDTYTKY